MSLWYFEKRNSPSSPWEEQRLAQLKDFNLVKDEFSSKGQNSLIRLKESWGSTVYPNDLKEP